MRFFAKPSFSAYNKDMSKNLKKLLIIDGNAIIHRSFHALPPTLRTKEGVLVNAVYGFASFLLKSLGEFRPEFIILTLDKPGPTFRHEAYAEYKANRTKAPDELYEQIPLAKNVAAAFNIPIFEKSSFEADDLIGTLCRQAEEAGNLETIIVTGDMDTLQLVNERVKVYTMSRGLSDSTLYDIPGVKAKYGLSPRQIIDYKALAGDPSDNIPGARGIGAKTATELLQNFNDIDGIYRAVLAQDKKIKARTLELLTASRDNVFLSKELATINCRAPVSLNQEQARFASFDLAEVLKIFSHLEFRSLLDKAKTIRDRLLKESGGQTEEGKEKKLSKRKEAANYLFLKTDQEIVDFLERLSQEKAFSFYLGTTSPEAGAEIFGVAVSLAPAEACFFTLNKNILPLWKTVVEKADIKKTGHDLKSAWRILKNNDIDLQGIEFDVMLAAYLLNPGERRYSLESLAFSELGIDKLTSADINNAPKQLCLDFSQLDPEKISLLACENADLIGRLQPLLAKKLKIAELTTVFQEIEMPLVAVLARMESRGINFDPQPIQKLQIEVRRKLTELEKEIWKFSGQEFNISSPKQLQEILFTKLELPAIGLKKTKTGISTADEELEKIRELHPVVALIQEYREFSKLDNTYLNALPKMALLGKGKIYTNFNQTIAATGRLSSNEPNLQNIPTRTEEGRKIRAAFVASPDFILAGFDYSQIELRLAAHLSQDNAMLKAFQKGVDIHTATAANINNVKIETVSKEMRRAAKATNFGIIYGQGPHGLSQSAGITYAEAREFIKKYFAAYPGIKKMVDLFIQEAREKGYAATLFGRKRPLPDIVSSLPMAKKAAERMAINTPIQGAAADLIKLAMIKISRLIADKEDEIRLLLQVHDELIFEVKPDKLEYYAEKIKNIMENSITLDVPIVVEMAQGNNWGELK